MINAASSNSTRPYMVRAMYEWCTDNGFTPYVAVHVDESVQVPQEYVKNGEIVLNISFDATSGLKLGNDFIEFKARFSGSARVIMVPMDRVLAIYARENGQGMAFPLSLPTPKSDSVGDAFQAPSDAPVDASPVLPRTLSLTSASNQQDATKQPAASTVSKRPDLKRIK